MRKDLPKILNLGKHLGFKQYVSTNGTLVTDYLAKVLANTCDGVDVSIDGLEQTHDRIRGHGTFRRALNAIRTLNKYKAGIASIGVTIMRLNFRELPALCTLAENLRCGISIQPIISTGVVFPRGYLLNEWLLFRESDIHELEEVIMLCLNQLLKNVSQPYLRIVVSYIKGNLRRKCIAGYLKLTIDSQGHIYPCSLWDKAIAKYVRGRLRKIWRSREFNEARLKMLSCNKCALGCYEPDNITFNFPLLRLSSELRRALRKA